MEELQQLFPDTVETIREYRSFVNQPERIQVSSQQDINDYDPTTLTNYYTFKVRLPRPALNVKSFQLARASLPLPITSIPDTECTWWYYALPQESPGFIYEDDPLNPGQPGNVVYRFDTAGVVYTLAGAVVPDSQVYFDSGLLKIVGALYLYNRGQASQGNVKIPCIAGNDTDYFIEYTNPQLAQLRSNYLRYVRLVPSNAQPELMIGFVGGFNRIFADYDDLVAEINNSTVDDPLNGQALLNNVAGTFKFVPNQIAFSYNARFSKIVFTGLDQSYTYVPAASDDPLWFQAAQELQERDRQNTRFVFTGIIEIVQPYIAFRNLNLRLGFNYATYFSGENFQSMIRPVPPAFYPNPVVPSPLTSFTAFDHVAPGYADLVYSSCCHIYCSLTGGSSVDSIAEKALLATLPLNSPTLGIGFHSLPLNNPLTKISNQLFEIDIELRTDSGVPFYIGNNAIFSCEIILTY